MFGIKLLTLEINAYFAYTMLPDQIYLCFEIVSNAYINIYVLRQCKCLDFMFNNISHAYIKHLLSHELNLIQVTNINFVFHQKGGDC